MWYFVCFFLLSQIPHTILAMNNALREFRNTDPYKNYELTLFLNNHPIITNQTKHYLEYPIQLSHDKVHANLNNQCLGYLTNNISLVTSITDGPQYPTDIFWKIVNHMRKSAKKFPTHMAMSTHLLSIPQVTRTIFQDHQNAIQSLEKQHLFNIAVIPVETQRLKKLLIRQASRFNPQLPQLQRNKRQKTQNKRNNAKTSGNS